MAFHFYGTVTSYHEETNIPAYSVDFPSHRGFAYGAGGEVGCTVDHSYAQESHDCPQMLWAQLQMQNVYPRIVMVNSGHAARSRRGYGELVSEQT